jgi:hypothetical protein
MTQFLRYIVLAAFSFGWAIPLCIALRFFGEWRHKVSPFSTTPRPNTDSFPYWDVAVVNLQATGIWVAVVFLFWTSVVVSRSHFSLRTLLTIVTLVCVGLAMFMWAAAG